MSQVMILWAKWNFSETSKMFYLFYPSKKTLQLPLLQVKKHHDFWLFFYKPFCLTSLLWQSIPLSLWLLLNQWMLCINKRQRLQLRVTCSLSYLVFVCQFIIQCISYLLCDCPHILWLLDFIYFYFIFNYFYFIQFYFYYLILSYYILFILFSYYAIFNVLLFICCSWRQSDGDHTADGTRPDNQDSGCALVQCRARFRWDARQ